MEAIDHNARGFSNVRLGLSFQDCLISIQVMIKVQDLKEGKS